MENVSSKKICIIINELYLGGAQRLVVDDIREFQRRGIDISLITLQSQEGRVTFENLCNLPSDKRHELLFKSLYDLSALMRLMSHLRRERYDVVITHLWFSNTVGRIAARLVGVPTLISFEHNVYDTAKSQKQFLLDKWLQKFTTRIIAVSQAVKDSLVHHGILSSNIDVVPNAIRVEDFQKPVDRMIIRRELKLSDDAFLFLTIGRLEKQKAHDILLHAFQKVSTGFLLIVGEGELRDSLEKLVESLGLQGRVFFLGVRKDIADLLSSADCFVFPSRWEGVGIVMLEALAAGLPLVVTDFAAALEIITDMSDGLVAPVDDVQSLSQKMQEILDSKELRDSLSEQGKSTAKRFSIETHVNSLLKIIGTA
jgi:glycosyltransferase involved in cell wall biosynthesis